jgi:hypothetical protein
VSLQEYVALRIMESWGQHFFNYLTDLTKRGCRELLARPFPYQEPTKNAAMICISSRGACGEDEFRLAPFGKRQIIGWEGRKPSGQKESICIGYRKF